MICSKSKGSCQPRVLTFRIHNAQFMGPANWQKEKENSDQTHLIRWLFKVYLFACTVCHIFCSWHCQFQFMICYINIIVDDKMVYMEQWKKQKRDQWSANQPHTFSSAFTVDGWTDDFRFYVLFNSISVMSGQGEVDSERLCAWNSVYGVKSLRLERTSNWASA